MAADALPPYVGRSSAAMVLTLQDTQLIVFPEKKMNYICHRSVGKVLENANLFDIFPKEFSA